MIRNTKPWQTLAPISLAITLLTASGLGHATNGMLMEGYGPMAAGLGGASMASDNGTAGMANNPATLALMGQGARLDIAVGQLGPKVASQAGSMNADSSATSFIMPAFGYTRRSANGLVWGVGVFAQGGMGTEYGADSFLAMGSGAPVRSELGVGRLILPLAMSLSPELQIGGSFDVVWSSLDLRMAASGAQLGGMVTSASGGLGGALSGMGGAPWTRIDFSDNNNFHGEASSGGYAAKLGLLYKARPDLSIGASWHSRTQLKDMQTSAQGAQLSAAGGFNDSGRMTVENFQFPAQFGAGVAWQANPAVQVVADVKRVLWSGVMDAFRMRYDSAGMGGSVSFAMPQNWNDQTVTQLGASWRMSEALVLRGGLNLSTNPVPDATVNPLFPAIVERHYTAGVGYSLGSAGDVNFAATLAPEVKVQSGSGVTLTHSQTNLQLMYSHRF
jgi:long-chain fatty acid transport protein